MKLIQKFKSRPCFFRVIVSLWLLSLGVMLLVFVFIFPALKRGALFAFLAVFSLVSVFLLFSGLYTNARNICELRDHIEKLGLEAKLPRFWGGVMCYRKVRAKYRDRNLILTSEGDEENLVLKFPLSGLRWGLFLYLESMNTPTTLLYDKPLLKNAFRYSLPGYNQEIVYKSRKIKELPPDVLKKLLEFAELLSAWKGNLYLNDKELKLIFPGYTQIERSVLDKALDVVKEIEKINNLNQIQFL